MRNCKLFVRLIIAAVACAACSNGQRIAGRDGGPGSDSGTGPSLGKLCSSACTGTFCQSSGPGITSTCGSSSGLSMPCLGTASGMYCTKKCSSDLDCAPAARAMRCLTTCAKFPEVAGLCWAQSNYTFMVGQVCGTPTSPADSGSPANRDTAQDLAIDAARDAGIEVGRDAVTASVDTPPMSAVDAATDLPCGQPGQSCCGGNTCMVGAQCVAGTCQPTVTRDAAPDLPRYTADAAPDVACGQLGQSCCSGSTCLTVGAQCLAGTCQQTVTPDARSDLPRDTVDAAPDLAADVVSVTADAAPSLTPDSAAAPDVTFDSAADVIWVFADAAPDVSPDSAADIVLVTTDGAPDDGSTD